MLGEAIYVVNRYAFLYPKGMGVAEESIKQRIRAAGPITFAEFMERALYGPGGYYTQGQPIGAGGDYYTSPAAHPAFGALLALQMEQMWGLLGSPLTFTVVEAGAGDGTLATDILEYAQHLDPGFYAALCYTALDAHPRGKSAVTPPKLRWGSKDFGRQSSDFGGDRFTGCILSNELIDALPVHRIRMRQGETEELYVALDGDALTERWDKPSTPEVLQRLSQDGVPLPEGQEAEVNLRAASWMAQAAQALDRGYALTIDYGDLAEDLFKPERSRGTVVSYYHHTLQGDPYSRIGRQDITAHANFTTLIKAGLAHGLQPVTLMTQAEFLRNLGLDLLCERLAAAPGQESDLAALRDLVKADGLGNFRVLIQSKNAPTKNLAALGHDLRYRTNLATRLASLPPPRLGERHIDLLRGRFPHQAETEMTGSWDDLLR